MEISVLSDVVAMTTDSIWKNRLEDVVCSGSLTRPTLKRSQPECGRYKARWKTLSVNFLLFSPDHHHLNNPRSSSTPHIMASAVAQEAVRGRSSGAQ